MHPQADTTPRSSTSSSEALPAQPWEAHPLDPCAIPEWDGLVSQNPEATVFHSRGWAQTLTASYGHGPCYLCRVEGQAAPQPAGAPPSGKGLSVPASGPRLKALLPLVEVDSWLTGRKGVSLPFSDVCPPLASEEDLRPLFDSAVDMGEQRRWKYVEFRGVPVRTLGMEPSMSFLGHTVDLAASEEEIFRRFEGSVRRAIRKAEGSGVEVATGNGPEEVRSYYDLHCRTRQRHGLPPQPFRFFENLQRFVLAAGRGFVATARWRNQPIASVVLFHFGRNAIYKYGASDVRHQELRGANLVMWRAIQECRQRGCASLHLGRTSLDNQGLRRFKLGFGSTEHALDYLRFDLTLRAPAFVRDRSLGPVNRLLSQVPRPVARWLGALLYPHAT